MFPLGTIDRMFKPLPPVPDHPALEREVLARWDDEGTFRQLREQNAGGPRFSFIDGPLTANNPKIVSESNCEKLLASNPD